MAADSGFGAKYWILFFVNMERESAGRALYEERLKMLPGLMMPQAPAWDELAEDVKERWRGYTDQRPVD